MAPPLCVGTVVVVHFPETARGADKDAEAYLPNIELFNVECQCGRTPFVSTVCVHALLAIGKAGVGRMFPLFIISVKPWLAMSAWRQAVTGGVQRKEAAGQGAGEAVTWKEIVDRHAGEHALQPKQPTFGVPHTSHARAVCHRFVTVTVTVYSVFEPPSPLLVYRRVGGSRRRRRGGWKRTVGPLTHASSPSGGAPSWQASRVQVQQPCGGPSWGEHPGAVPGGGCPSPEVRGGCLPVCILPGPREEEEACPHLWQLWGCGPHQAEVPQAVCWPGGPA